MTKFDFNSIDICIYHKSCSDGFCSAYLIWAIGQHTKSIPEFIPMNPGTKLTHDELNKFTGKSVLVVDLSFSREDVLNVQRVAKQLLIIDHHKTAAADLEGLTCAIFDMNYSGAGLLWRTLATYWVPDGSDDKHEYMPIDEPSALVQYTQDRDIGANKLPFTKEVNAWIRTIPHTFHEWAKMDLILADKSCFQMVVSNGMAIIAAQKNIIDVAVSHAAMVNLYTGPEKENVIRARVTSNIPPAMLTDVGYGVLAWEAELPERERTNVVVMLLILSNGDCIYSMRSTNGVDVSKIATAWGGGGHAQACGFKGKLINGLPWVMVDDSPALKTDAPKIIDKPESDKFSLPTPIDLNAE